MKSISVPVHARMPRLAPSWRSTALRCAAVWLALFALAFVNGAVREVILIGSLAYNALVAQQLSALTGILLFTGFVWQVWPWMRLRTLVMSMCVGLAWFVATAMTEAFVLNIWLSDMTLNQVAAQYNVSEGKLWPFVLLWIGLLPPILWATY